MLVISFRVCRAATQVQRSDASADNERQAAATVVIRGPKVKGSSQSEAVMQASPPSGSNAAFLPFAPVGIIRQAKDKRQQTVSC